MGKDKQQSLTLVQIYNSPSNGDVYSCSVSVVANHLLTHVQILREFDYQKVSFNNALNKKVNLPLKYLCKVTNYQGK